MVRGKNCHLKKPGDFHKWMHTQVKTRFDKSLHINKTETQKRITFQKTEFIKTDSRRNKKYKSLITLKETELVGKQANKQKISSKENTMPR